MRRTLALALALAPGALVTGSILQPTPAHAVYEVCNPYSLQEFRDGMAAIEKAFEDYDLNEARYQAELAEKLARCVDSPVTPADVARFARLRAQMYFFDQKLDSAARWMLVALAANGSEMPDDIGEEHPLRLVLRDVMMEEHGPVSYDGHFMPPKKGVVLHNGRMAQQPEGYQMVRGLVQVFDKKGNFVDGFWVNGADYSGDLESQYVSATEGPYKPAKWWEGPSTDQAPDLAQAYQAVTGMSADDMDDDLGLDIDVGPVATRDAGDDDGGSDAGGDDGGADDGSADADVPGPGDGDGDGEGGEGPLAPTGDGSASTPPRPPKPPKDGGGVNAPLLSTGLGLVAVGGALYGVGYAVNSTAGNGVYTGDQLASRRTTANTLVLGSAVLGAAGVGIGITGLVADGGGRLGLRGRW